MIIIFFFYIFLFLIFFLSFFCFGYLFVFGATVSCLGDLYTYYATESVVDLFGTFTRCFIFTSYSWFFFFFFFLYCVSKPKIKRDDTKEEGTRHRKTIYFECLLDLLHLNRLFCLWNFLQVSLQSVAVIMVLISPRFTCIFTIKRWTIDAFSPFLGTADLWLFSIWTPVEPTSYEIG